MRKKESRKREPRKKEFEAAEKLVAQLGQRYSTMLGIDVDSGNAKEVFKWFLCAVLFAAPIGEKNVLKTYREFEKAGLLSPRALLKAGWHALVKRLDAGGYTRYDFKTADKLLEMAGKLEREYKGNLNLLFKQSRNREELEAKLTGLAKGIGPTTAAIFLREMRLAWGLEPGPSHLVLLAAKNLGAKDAGALKKLGEEFVESTGRKEDAIRLETALMRLGRGWCRKRKCGECFLKQWCRKQWKKAPASASYRVGKLSNAAAILQRRI